MQFAKVLRERVRHGEITTSVRIWKSCRVKVGGRYKLGDGHVVVDRVSELSIEDITPTLARQGGFGSVGELLRVARHGTGSRVFLVEFHFEAA